MKRYCNECVQITDTFDTTVGYWKVFNIHPEVKTHARTHCDTRLTQLSVTIVHVILSLKQKRETTSVQSKLSKA